MKKGLVLFIVLVVLISACGGGGDGAGGQLVNSDPFRLKSSTPSDGAMNVPLNSSIILEMIADIDPVKTDKAEFNIMHDVTIIMGELAIKGSLFIFTPSADFPAGTTFITRVYGYKGFNGQ